MGYTEPSSIHAEQRYENFNPAQHLANCLIKDIGHDIISISTPGSGVYPGNEAFSVGLARLLNVVTSLKLPHESPHS